MENPPKSGRYETSLDPGNYRAFIFKEGYEEYHKEIVMNPGQNSFKVNLRTVTPHEEGSANKRPYSATYKGARPLSGTLKKNVSFDNKQDLLDELGIQEEQKQKHLLTFRLFDSSSGKPLLGAVVKILDYQTQRVMPVKADDKGECVVDVTETYEGKLMIECNNYFKIEELYGEIHNFDLRKFKFLEYPLIQKPTTQDEMKIMIHPGNKEDVVRLHVISPDDSDITASTHDVIIENGGNQDGRYSILIKNLKNIQKGVFRIYAEIDKPEAFRPENLRIFLIQFEKLSLLDVPLMMAPAKFWDIGLVHVSGFNTIQFVPVNCLISHPITKDLYLSDYQEFLKFVRNSKSVDLKTLFGFTSADQAYDDYFTTKEKILQTLDKYGFENNNITPLLDSSRDQDGLCSFNHLEKKFLSVNPPFDFVHEKPKKAASSGGKKKTTKKAGSKVKAEAPAGEIEKPLSLGGPIVSKKPSKGKETNTEITDDDLDEYLDEDNLL